MKNIHVLPTDKPSRIWVNNLKRRYELETEPLIGSNTAMHIYITSYEEIKDGDWILEISDNSIFTIQIQPNTNLSKYKKVILTTDQDLIASGVQPIDDEFLEWFVKNPNCEVVDVKNISIKVVKGYKNNGEIDYYYTNGYEIIIPQEEPKQEMAGKAFYESADKVIVVKRQETLEEAAENYGWRIKRNTFSDPVKANDLANSAKEDFIEGAKWQAKRMYSEEEVLNLWDWLNDGFIIRKSLPTREELIGWFEQFKNK